MSIFRLWLLVMTMPYERVCSGFGEPYAITEFWRKLNNYPYPVNPPWYHKDYDDPDIPF